MILARRGIWRENSCYNKSSFLKKSILYMSHPSGSLVWLYIGGHNNNSNTSRGRR
jgi:hypothetical protein